VGAAIVVGVQPAGQGFSSRSAGLMPVLLVRERDSVPEGLTGTPIGSDRLLQLPHVEGRPTSWTGLHPATGRCDARLRLRAVVRLSPVE
jgi:hypothetical protein